MEVKILKNKIKVFNNDDNKKEDVINYARDEIQKHYEKEIQKGKKIIFENIELENNEIPYSII